MDDHDDNVTKKKIQPLTQNIVVPLESRPKPADKGLFQLHGPN